MQQPTQKISANLSFGQWFLVVLVAVIVAAAVSIGILAVAQMGIPGMGRPGMDFPMPHGPAVGNESKPPMVDEWHGNAPAMPESAFTMADLQGEWTVEVNETLRRYCDSTGENLADAENNYGEELAALSIRVEKDRLAILRDGKEDRAIIFRIDPHAPHGPDGAMLEWTWDEMSAQPYRYSYARSEGPGIIGINDFPGTDGEAGPTLLIFTRSK